MCLILWALSGHPRYRLILAANRDEFYQRPTSAAAYGSEGRGVLGGLDLQAGGTWLALGRNGRLAALTNYRDPETARPDALSRGHLVKDFVCGTAPPAAYLETVHNRRAAYNDFNLIVADGEQMWYLGSREQRPRPVAPGIHGLSNHLLDTPWPKVTEGKAALAAATAGDEVAPDALLALLTCRRQPEDHQLPDTGVGLAWERILSPRFIVTPSYGTRSSSVLLVSRQGRATFCEWTFAPGVDPPAVTGRRCFKMALEKSGRVTNLDHGGKSS
jgi:uncharacterized protein with NRDE domain